MVECDADTFRSDADFRCRLAPGLPHRPDKFFQKKSQPKTLPTHSSFPSISLFSLWSEDYPPLPSDPSLYPLQTSPLLSQYISYIPSWWQVSWSLRCCQLNYSNYSSLLPTWCNTSVTSSLTRPGEVCLHILCPNINFCLKTNKNGVLVHIWNTLNIHILSPSNVLNQSISSANS